MTDERAGQLIAAVEQRDWARVRALLHPYLHWNEPGVGVRGRTKVMARLQSGPVPAVPDAVELRDGQIYRWTRASG